MNKSALLSLDLALENILRFSASHPVVEVVSTFEADQRVLAEDIHSEIQVPGFDNSAMDGYAFCHADFLSHKGILQAGQRIAAGHFPEKLKQGHADRIFTGAPVPQGADTVVMQEECEVLPDGRIHIRGEPNPGQCIRHKGEDIALHACILSKGQMLNPASIGLAASIGRASLNVFKRPKVALFSTGDELVMPGDVAPAHMPPGSIYNSNRFFLKALLKRLGCEVSDLGILPDNLHQTQMAFQNACEDHDLILTSGGVSVGEEDHVKPAIQSLGELQLWSLAIKPGKPFAYGQLNPHQKLTHFIGLPGNPVSSFVTFLLLARPFILNMQGVHASTIHPYAMRADFSWPKADKRREFLRVKRNAAGGLDLFDNQGSGVLTSAVWGDGLVDNPPGNTIRPGDSVGFIPFFELMS
jgi:molybdopterin molybdotransferase